MLPFEIKQTHKGANHLNNSSSRKSQEFYFGAQNIRHIGKRTGKVLRPQHNNQSFLKLQESNETQDYLIVVRQSLSSFSEIPRQIEANTTLLQSSKQPDISKITQNQQPKMQADVKIVKEQQKKVDFQIESKQNIDRNKEKDSRKSIKSVDRSYATVENSPFVVQNISNVKHRYSVGGRQSQQFLLELLKSEKGSKEINPTSNEIFERNQEQSQKKEMKKQQASFQKQKKDQQVKEKKPLIQDKKQVEIKQKPKSKRVTINDRGKIKLPTDSFSLEFNVNNPIQDRKKFNQIQQKQQEYQNEQQSSKRRQKVQYIQVDQKKQTDFEVQTQQQLKKPPLRKGNIKKNSKAKSSKSSKQPQIQKKQQKLSKKRKIEDKIVSQELNSGSESAQQPINPKTGRPIRSKRQPLDYYKNQKTLYNGKNEVIMPGITTQLFLEILGFTINQTIENSTINIGSNYMQHMFRLRPKQQLSSIGIDEAKLNEHLKPLANFINMWICPDKPTRKFLLIKIDNFPQQILDRQFVIERDQRVQIKNTSQNKLCNIRIHLEKQPNSKQKQE